MKLLLCRHCNDVVKFGANAWRACECGRSSARYLDDGYHAEIRGDFATALGMNQHSLSRALRQSATPTAVAPRVDAWVHDPNYYRIARVAPEGARTPPVPAPRRKLTNLDLCESAEPFPLPPSL